MIKINHRVNTIEQLQKTPENWGVEVDVRDYAGKIVCAHDAFENGIELEKLLQEYKHKMIIFNTKSDGLVNSILDLINDYKIEDYFFLDLANPTMINLMRNGNSNFAVRYSEFEPIEFTLEFIGKAKWVWIDCFTKLPIDMQIYRVLKKNFKMCLVSPELQAHPREMIKKYQEKLINFPMDAVCSDFCEDWNIL